MTTNQLEAWHTHLKQRIPELRVLQRQPPDPALSLLFSHQITEENTRLQNLLLTFVELDYPAAEQVNDPLLQTVIEWCAVASALPRQAATFGFWPNSLQPSERFSLTQQLHLAQKAEYLAQVLDLPMLHPGKTLSSNYLQAPDTTSAILAYLEASRGWVSAAEHQSFLQQRSFLWHRQAQENTLIEAWPLFQYFYQQGVPVYWDKPFAKRILGAAPKWQAMPAELGFMTWCLLQQTLKQAISARSWQNWVSTLPAEHAAHTLDVPQAFQVYNLWATLHAPGQPPNRLSLLQMVEPAPARGPTEIGPVADFAL